MMKSYVNLENDNVKNLLLSQTYIDKLSLERLPIKLDKIREKKVLLIRRQ